jgi:hypothetical protein
VYVDHLEILQKLLKTSKWACVFQEEEGNKKYVEGNNVNVENIPLIFHFKVHEVVWKVLR